MRIMMCFIVVLFAYSAQAKVLITINHTRYLYEEPVRLDRVLIPVANAADWYWPTTAVYKMNDATVEAERKVVLAEIDKLLADEDKGSDRYIALISLRQQVAAWSLARRVPMKVDADAIKQKEALNPRFEDGEYLIRLQTRAQVVHLLGLVEKPGEYALAPQLRPRDYIKRVPLLDDAENDVVYVIAPDASIHKQGIAYWNASTASLMPGSQIYIPFYTHLFAGDLDSLNQQVAALAANRILP